MPFGPRKRGRGNWGRRKSTGSATPAAKRRKLETPGSTPSTSKNSSFASGNETPKERRGRPKGSTNKKPSAARLKLLEDNFPIKTRRILKSNKTNPHCTLCKAARKEPLKACCQCGLSYHLNHCLNMPDNQVVVATALENWHCPKCIRCSTCQTIIDDVRNVECSFCLRAWHGHCFKGKFIGKDSICRRCKGKQGEETPSTPSSSNKNQPTPSKEDSRKSPPKTTPKKRLPKGWVTIPDYIMHGGDIPSTSTANPRPEEEAVDEILSSRARVWDNLVEEYGNIKPMVSPKKERSKSRSPEKRPTAPIPLAPLSAQKISTVEDYDLFQSSLKQLREEGEDLHPAPSTSTSHGGHSAAGKWVYLGEAPKMKALYATPYPENVLKGESIYVCPLCMFPTCYLDVYRIHQENCEFRHPPGNEIYREGNLSFFEVDGAAQRLYCRHLCLFAKMFISSKTLHHEVETFIFYVLTENTEKGCMMVAYFSKEKNPSKNNNLSCLLTIPGQNRRGYGKLLIDMSYELSRLEHKIGSPEHPLSDLGLFAYRGYWRASILQHLRSLSNVPSTSIKSIALATRINPSDIINQLLRDKLLAYIDGNYFIKTGKRAFKWPLSFFRRRAIDTSKLVWQPGFDISDLDPAKLNYYV